MRGTPEIEIVVDTREQTPLAFDVPTVRRKLDTGDYSVVGYESEFTVERKSITDLVHTVIHDRERFERELRRMDEYRFKRLLVVGTYDAVVTGPYPFSFANPKAVIGSVRAFEVRYNLPVTFASNEREASMIVTEWAKYYVRERLIEDREDEELARLFAPADVLKCA